MVTPARRSSRRSASGAPPERIAPARPGSARKGAIGTKAAKAKPRTPKPEHEVVGKRISIHWPNDKSWYDGRVIDYNSKAKSHKVIYDEDNSIEIINLSRRKFKLIEPDQEEKKAGSIIGKKILLDSLEIDLDEEQGNKSNNKNNTRKENCAAIVLRSAPLNPQANLEDDDDDDEDGNANENNNNTSAESEVLHLVVYPKNEYMTTVDLQKHSYTIVDMHTLEKIKEVNPDDDVEQDNSPPSTEKKKNDDTAPINDEAKSQEKKGMEDTDEKESPSTSANAPIAITPAPALGEEKETTATAPTETETATPEILKINTSVSFGVSKKNMISPVSKTITFASTSEASPAKPPGTSGATTDGEKSAAEIGKSGTSTDCEKGNDGVDKNSANSIVSPEKKPSETAVAATSIVDKPIDVSMSVGNTNAIINDKDNNASNIENVEDNPINVDPLMDDELPLADIGNDFTNDNNNANSNTVADVVLNTEKPDVTPSGRNTDTTKPADEDVDMVDAPNNNNSNQPAADSTSQAVKAAIDATNLLDAGTKNNTDDEPPSEGSTIPLIAPKESEHDDANNKNNPDAMEVEEKTETIEKVKDLAVAKRESEKNNPASQAGQKATAEGTTIGAPLTVENVKTLDEKPKPLKDADENLGDTTAEVVQDEDSKTVSDGENENWVESSSNKLENPKSVEKKFVSIKVDGDGDKNNKKERIAYVDSYLSNGSHFVQFHDKEGEHAHIILTSENCRVLTKEEVDALGGKKEEEVEEKAGVNSKKRKISNGMGSSKRQRASESGRAIQKPPMDASLVGKCITVLWPQNATKYKCLVIGCASKNGITKHKVFYVEDESTETMELSKRTWNMGKSEQLPWNSTGLVGKRLYVYWEGEYTDEKSQKKAEALFGKEKCKVPYEVFVVKFLGPHKYRLLYTIDDNLEDRILTDDDRGWNVLEDGVKEVDGLPIIAWEDDNDEPVE